MKIREDRRGNGDGMGGAGNEGQNTLVRGGGVKWENVGGEGKRSELR